jgi:hypothetical protein
LLQSQESRILSLRKQLEENEAKLIILPYQYEDLTYDLNHEVYTHRITEQKIKEHEQKFVLEQRTKDQCTGALNRTQNDYVRNVKL